MPADKKSEFPGQLIRQLGKKSDQDLATEFHIPVHKIRVERRRRSILAFTYINWTPQRIAVLGTMPDKRAAKLVGVTNSAAFTKRVSLGIPPFGKSRETAKFQWKAACRKRLGKVPDEVLAEELGISASVIAAKRHSLGITASRPVTSIRKPWTKRELAMLGKKPDTVVAEKTGRGRRHVRAKRELLGISPFQKQTTIQWTQKSIRKLGTMPDKDLAIELGVALATVALHRRRFSIPAWGRNTKAK